MKLTLLEPLAVTTRKIWVVTALIEVAIALVAWQIAGGGLIPGPLTVLHSLLSFLVQRDFYSNLISSFSLTMFGMGLSILIALLFSYLSVIPLFNPISKFVMQCRYLTLTGLIFLFTLLTKNGSDLKISLLIFGIVPFFTTSLLSIVASIKSEEYDLCRTLRFNNWETVYEVIVLGRLDQVIEVMRQNFAISWLMITMVEGLSMSDGGLGVMLIKANKYINLPNVFALLVVVFMMGLVFDALFNWVRSFLFPYCNLQRGTK